MIPKTTKEIIIENAIATARHRIEYRNPDILWFRADNLKKEWNKILSISKTRGEIIMNFDKALKEENEE